MATRRSRTGDRTPSDRRQVGLTVPRRVKDRMAAAARVLDWSVGDWVLAAAAEFGDQVPDMSSEPRKRPAVADATFCALYLTAEERQELDDQATVRGLNRSAFVTVTAQLALGADRDAVLRSLQTGEEVGLGASEAFEARGGAG